MIPVFIYFFLGMALLWGMESKPSWPYFVALSVLTGTGILPLLMFVMDVLHLPLTPLYISLVSLLLSGGLFYVFRKKRPPASFRFKIPRWYVLTILLLIFILIGGITWKAIYWPPFEYDTILGYDFLARAIWKEQCLHNSVLLNKQHIIASGPRLFYPPLLSLNLSWWYMNGYSGKYILLLYNLAFPPVLFYFLRRLNQSDFRSAFVILLLLVTPELYSHMALALTNYPHALYCGIGLLSIIYGSQKEDLSWVLLGFIFLGFAIFTRSDTLLLLPMLPLMIWWGTPVEKKKKLKWQTGLFIPIVIYLFWNFYIKMYMPLSQEAFFVNHFFWDTPKMQKVWFYAFELWTSTSIYGLTFYCFAVWIMLEIILKRVNLSVLTYLLGSLILYTLIYYQIDDSHGTLFEKPGGWMPSGYKRGMFVFVVWIWSYMGMGMSFSKSLLKTEK